MKMLHYLKRALELPPRVTLQKVWKKAAGKYRKASGRRRDFAAPTFFSTEPLPAGPLFQILKELSLDPPQPLGHLLVEEAESVLRHEFNLLGSGRVSVAHGIQRGGCGGHVYGPGPAVTADGEGRWLEGRINEANLTESRRVWKLIFSEPLTIKNSEFKIDYVPIDWQLDFRSGYRWDERTWSPEIQYGRQPGADVKVPWELARAQHLPQLALAYSLSGEENFRESLCREFRNEVLDFIAVNPPRFGVNWSCAMDVGIRIANWLMAYDLFRGFGVKWDEPFEKVFAQSVYAHAHHLFNNLEWDPELRSNHYLADLAGLLFAAAYLPHGPETDHWLKFSTEEFLREVESQFQPDGSNFEGSTSYHRLSAEMAFYGTALILGLPESKVKVLGKNPSEFFTEAYRSRLEKMIEFTMDFTKPDGNIVQVGDNDSGRFFKMFPDGEGGLNHRHLAAAANGIIPRRDFAAASASREWEGRIVRALAGGKVLSGSAKNQGGERQRSYPDFGLYLWKKESMSLYVRCGSVGQKGNGGHAHNDQLSFELAVKGVSLVVDPGTYVYTPLPEQRNLFRSTAMHNTLVVEGLEQNIWEPGVEGLFRIADRAKARVVQFDNRAFIGEHMGFGTAARRTLNLKEGRLEGLEECDHPGQKAVYFHLASGSQVQLYPPAEVKVSLGSAYVRLTSQDGRWELEQSFVSKAYGEKEPAPVLVLKSTAKNIGWKIQILD